MVTDTQKAPGRLERVRELLNTEWIPNDTRVRRDDLTAYLQRRGYTPAQARELRLLRGELRAAVAGPARSDAILNGAVARHGVRLAIRDGDIAFEHAEAAAAEFLGVVLASINEGTWHRLKACPDCEWVFFDKSRNASKRWCAMVAQSVGGRSCGTLAKVRDFRRRQARRSRRTA